MEEVGNKTEVKPLKDPKTGLFVEGNPGGPGRPAGSRSFTSKVKEALEKIADGKDYTYEEAFIKAILKNSIVDQDVGMMRTVWEQLDGKPLQRIAGEDGGVLQIQVIRANGEEDNQTTQVSGQGDIQPSEV